MHRYLFHRLWLLLLLAAGTSSCVNERPATGANPTPPAEWIAWRDKRHESVAGTNGWATLVGLDWLKEGPNSAGSDPTNQAVLPRGRAAATIGVFTRDGRNVRYDAAPGVVALIEGRHVQTAEFQSDRVPEPTRLQVGSLSIVVIERGERLGLRVRDPEAPARVHFAGLKCFPYDPAWRVSGRFEPFVTPKKLRVPDIIGDTQEFPSPGAIVFTHEGREYRLDVAEEPDADDYFVMLHDLTAGDSTYGSGRFLRVAKPDAQGRVVIDFNRAYTPPCGFTDFATCPLPPRQNWLPFPLRAGELKPAGH